MYVQRGSYIHALNETKFVFERIPQYADNGALIGTQAVVSLQGMLTGADADALSLEMLRMEAAYSVNTGDFYLLKDDMSTKIPLYTLTGSQAIGGIRCTRIRYPNSSPGELTTYLNYEINLEANFGGIGIVGGGNSAQNTLVSWQQSILIRGNGGPRKVAQELLTGMPVIQIVAQRTPVFIVQRGSAVGLYRRPNREQPLWPQFCLNPEVEIEEDSALSVGGQGNQQQQRNLGVSWNYQFLSPGPLSGSPGSGF